MQISTTLFYDRSAHQMAALNQRAGTLQTQIATGRKLETASDDVVAYQRLALLKQGGADDVAYSANIGVAKSLLAQSDSTLTSIETQLQRVSELVVQANGGALSDDNRKVIAAELDGILDTLVGLANTRDPRGQPLFGAATGDSAVTRNADGSIGFTGTGTPATIPIGDGADIVTSDPAARVFGGIATASGTSDTFAIIADFAAALKAGTGAGAAGVAANDGIKAALDQLNVVRGSVGARAARLDLAAERLTQVAAVRETARSAIEDTDITAAITELQKTLTVLQATQASFSKLGQLSLFDYLR